MVNLICAVFWPTLYGGY